MMRRISSTGTAITFLLGFLAVISLIYWIRFTPRSILTTLKERKALNKFVESQQQYDPICDKHFKDADGDSNLLVVPRRAYYDVRNEWKPGKGHVVVILTEMSDSAFDSMVACNINGYYTAAIDDLREDTRWVRSNFKGHTHSLVFVFCIFVPPEAIVDGASVKLIHKRSSDSCYSRVETEFPLVVKRDYKNLEKGPNSVVICIATFNRPPYFNEWLKYHKHLGADLVHIATDSSFAVNATKDYPFLKEALDSGFAKMEVWRNPLGHRVFWHSELVKYQNCMLQYLGVYQYAFMLDFDDFFNPLLPNHKDLHYYVEEFYKDRPKLATAYVKWVNYMDTPDLSRTPQNGNLTTTIKDFTKICNKFSGSKALHRIEGVLYVGIHNSFTRVRGYHSSWTDSRQAYVAHIRPRESC